MIWLLYACVPEPGKSVHDPDHDFDGDGYHEQDGDCDDSDPDVTLPPPWFLDADGDGYGQTEAGVACEAPAGGVLAGGDCDDGDSAVHPLQPDPCDGLDAACDGSLCEPELLLREEHAELTMAAGDGEGGTVKVSGTRIGVGATSRENPFQAGDTARMIVGSEVITFSFPEEGDHTTLSPVGDLDDDGVTDWLAASYCYQDGCDDETESAAFLLDGTQLEDGVLGSQGRILGPVGSCVGHASAPLDGGFAVSGACANGDAGIVWLVSTSQADLAGDLDLSSVTALVGDDPYLSAPAFTMASGDLDGDGVLDLALGNYGHLAGLMVLLVEDAMEMPETPLSTIPPLSSELSTSIHTGKGAQVLFFPDPEGTERLIIGAPGDPEDDGRVYIDPPRSGDFGDAPLELLGDASFGAALADLGDIDGDGVHDLAIGEPDGDELYSSGSSPVGYVRIVSGADLTEGNHEIDELALLVVEGEPGARLGVSLAGGDLDGDGRGDLVVGQEDPSVGPAVLVFMDLLAE
jgi:hypothetical protein